MMILEYKIIKELTKILEQMKKKNKIENISRFQQFFC